MSLITGVTLDWLGLKKVIPLGAFAVGIGVILFVTGNQTIASIGRFLQGAGGAAGDPEAAARLAMAATLLHWSLHPWAMYAIVALALSIFSYNKGLPMTVRSIFYPILGERIWGWPGHLVDILAVFATLFGLATSLGFGAKQAAAGMNYLFGIGGGNVTLVLLITGITAVAIVSIVAGVEKGVKRLSEINMFLAFMLLMFMVFVGPTLLIATNFFNNIVSYLGELPFLSNPFGREDVNYSQGWTTFYWGWWISWSPFVGMFIARVSRGRSVREFLISVMLIPTTVSIFWFTAFGTTAIDQARGGFDGAAFFFGSSKVFTPQRLGPEIGCRCLRPKMPGHLGLEEFCSPFRHLDRIFPCNEESSFLFAGAGF